MEKVALTTMDPKSKEALIHNPVHGMEGRRIVDRDGTACYDLVWYHSAYGWMNRCEAWEVWQKASCKERQNFPNVIWWP